MPTDGLTDCVRFVIDSRTALLCVLSKSCTEAAYSRLVEALCTEHGINLLRVPDGKKLGEWAGLCKYDKDGEPRKVVNCSCVVVKEFGEQSEALTELLEYFKKK